MKKYSVMIAGLMLVAARPPASARTEPTAFAADEPAGSAVEGQKWIRSESELSEVERAQMPFDAFLWQSGYMVYPVEEDVVKLQAMVSQNAMILHKEFIPRRVRVLRQVDGHGSDRSSNGVPGKKFMIVCETGSISPFMVDVNDLHFVQRQDKAPNNSK